MSQFCPRCDYVMMQEITQSAYHLTCACGLTKTPSSAIVISNDYDVFSDNNVCKIIGDDTVQKINIKCKDCKEYYQLLFRCGNKDVQYVCKCSAKIPNQTKKQITVLPQIAQ